MIYIQGKHYHYHAGFGLAFPKTMAAGLFIITYNSTAVPEVVPKNCGKLCEPENIKNLADTLEILIKNDHLKKESGINGQIHSSKITWKRSAARLISVLKTEAGE